MAAPAPQEETYTDADIARVAKDSTLPESAVREILEARAGAERAGAKKRGVLLFIRYHTVTIVSGLKRHYSNGSLHIGHVMEIRTTTEVKAADGRVTCNVAVEIATVVWHA